MRTLLLDTLYAWRTLRKSPAFAIVAVLSLALGVAVNTAIFSLVNALLAGSTPYPHPERLVVIWETAKGPGGENRRSPAIANAADWASHNSTLEDIGLAETFIDSRTLIADGPAEAVFQQTISSNLLPILGVQPMLGRGFTPGRDAILLAYPFWKRRFGGDPGVVGRTVLFNGKSSIISGVMPPRFVIFGSNDVDAWVNLNMHNPANQTRKDHWYTAIARLKPGVGMAQAQAQMDTVAAALASAYPETNRDTGARIADLRHYVVDDDDRRNANIMLGAVGFVLLIACANVANLMLARLTVRRPEMTLRASLGASRTRLVRQLLTESALVAVMGGIGGWLLTGWAIDALSLAVPRLIAGLYPTNADPRVLIFTTAITALTPLAFGLAPAWQVSRLDLSAGLQQASRTTAGRPAHRLRSGMVVAEVALAVVLLAGTGLMIRSLLRVEAVDTGFDSHNVITMQTHLAGTKYVDAADRARGISKVAEAADLYYARLRERISVLPNVESAAYTSDLPDTGTQWRTFTIAGKPAPPESERSGTAYYEVSPSFFATMHVPVLMGRVFDQNDRNGTPWTVVIDETFAKRFFPNENPVGKFIRFRYEPYKVEEEHPRLIVGVVGAIKFHRRGTDPIQVAYASDLQQPQLFPGGRTSAHLRRRILIRTRGDLEAATPALTAAVRSIAADLDKEIPVTKVKSMRVILAETELFMVYLTRLVAVFGGLATILAAVGIYGVMSYLVTERTREIGIRMALGAERGGVLRYVLGKALLLTGVGVLAGAGAAVALTRLISTWLYAVSALDPITYAAVVLALAAVAGAASYLPARRAARLDPMSALRYE